MYELTKGYTKVVVLLPFLILQQLWQTFGESL